MKTPWLLAVALVAVLLAGCGDDDGSSSDPGSSTRAAAEVASDPPASGFKDTSGVTDIPAYGAEAGAAERAAAEQVLNDYIEAARDREWAEACALLTAATAAELRGLVEGSKRIENETCGEALRLISAPSPGEAAPYYGPARIAALRIKRGGGAGEGAGFALFHGDDGSDYWVSMKIEAGEWKVTTPAARPL